MTITKAFTIAKVAAKQDLGIHIRIRPDGHIAFSGKNGTEYAFPARLKRASEDRSQLDIVWDDEHDDPEQIIRFSPDGHIQIQSKP